jgi:hypothetical protein
LSAVVILSVAKDLELAPLQRNHLTLRSERSERLEGWATDKVLVPTLRDARKGALLRVRWCCGFSVRPFATLRMTAVL